MTIMKVWTRERWGGAGMMSGNISKQSRILRKEHTLSQDGPYILQKILSLQAAVWHLTHVHDHLSLPLEQI